MNILVTGGLGAFGSWVTRELIGLGHRPVVYARHLDTSLAKDILGRFDFENGDVTDLPHLLHVLKKNQIERIIHLAAIILAQSNPYLAVHINIGGTMNIIEASRILNISRVVYSSTEGIFGSIQGEYGQPRYRPLTEEHPKNPMSMYDITKLFGEQAGLNYHRNFGLDFIALRFAHTYGPGKLLRHGAFSIHGQIVENAFLGKPVEITRGGDQKDDMVYNKDVGHAIVLACLVEKVEHRTFNIGTGKGTTLKEMATIVKTLIPQSKIKIGDGLDYLGFGVNYYSIFDISRAEKELGYRSPYDLEAGVRDYIETMKRLNLGPI